jgi:hypothetical protein
MLSRLLPANWNDVLSIILLVGIPVLWVAFTLPPSVEGATIVVWTLVAQFYFRKTPAVTETEGNPDTVPPK